MQKAADECNIEYARLLVCLEDGFRGDAGKFDAAVGAMKNLREKAQTLLTMQYPGQPGYSASPTFDPKPEHFQKARQKKPAPVMA